MSQQMISRLALIAVFMTLAIGSGVARAQGGLLEYGVAVTGRIEASGLPPAYSFNGTANELIHAQIFSMTPGLAPQVTLLSPNGTQLAASVNDPLTPGTNLAQLSYRLLDTGNHTLLVESLSKQSGDFVISLEARPAGSNVLLSNADTITANLNTSTGVQTFDFQLTPTAATTLTLTPTTLGSAFAAEVRDDNGRLVGRVDHAVQSVQFQIAPGPGNIYFVSVIGSPPETALTVEIGLNQFLADFSAQTAGDTCTNNAQFIADVNIPDGTVIPVGVPFIKAWRLRNIGTCTWDSTYSFTQVSGEGIAASPETIPVPYTPPNVEVDLSVLLNMPVETPIGQTQRAAFQLVAPDGTPFGSTPFVEVVVGNSQP